MSLMIIYSLPSTVLKVFNILNSSSSQHSFERDTSMSPLLQKRKLRHTGEKECMQIAQLQSGRVRI
jgi:hypothetical protein